MKRQIVYCCWYWVLCLSLSYSAFGQGLYTTGLPFVRNFSPRDYGASTQNWSCLQDSSGLIYVGNSDGVLTFDGYSWQLTPLSNQSLVRSMAMGKNGRIYVGGVGDLGYLCPNKKGQLSYQSLLAYLPENITDLGDIWKTYAFRDKVYFQSFTHILVWDGYKFAEVYEPIGEETFHFSFLVNNELYVREWGQGLLKLNGGKLDKVSGGEVFADERIYAMLPMEGGRMLIATRTQGVYIYAPQESLFSQPESFATIGAYLKDNPIYHGIVLKNGEICLATLGGGVIRVSQEGKIEEFYNKKTGLQDETVWYLYEDRQQGLWLALDNGIARVELGRAIRYWGEDRGISTGVMGVIRHEGDLYVAMGLGVSKMDKSGYCSPLKEITSQTWDMLEVRPDGEPPHLLIASSNGIYRYQKGIKAQLIFDEDVAFSLYQPQEHPNRLFAGLLEGLAVFEYQQGKWQKLGNIKGVNEEIRGLCQDSLGNIWASSQYNGVMRLHPTGEPTVWNITRYDTLSGLYSLKGNELLPLDNQLFVGGGEGVLHFDATANRFVHDNNLLDTPQEIVNMQRGYDSVLWVSGRKIPASPIQYRKNGKWVKEPFLHLPQVELEPDGLYPDSKDSVLTWIGVSDGLYCFNSTISFDYQHLYNSKIRKVFIGEDSLLFGGNHWHESDGMFMADKQSVIHSLPYSNNTIRFGYAAMSFDGDASSNLFRYMLEGYEEGWSNWQEQSEKEYTNLYEGSYTFKVQAKNIYGHLSEEASYTFVIQAPWYRTKLMLLGYVLGFAILIWGLVRYNTRRLKQDNERLEHIVSQRTAEIVLQKEEIEAQSENLKQMNRQVLQQNEQVTRQHSEIQKAYANIRTLSDIGQELTAILNLKELIGRVYQKVNELMDASAFGIGLYNTTFNRIDYDGFMENGEELAFHFDSLDDNTLAVFCLKNSQPVFINSVPDEIQQYLTITPKELASKAGEIPQSVIYLPLVSNEKTVGVITVQSFNKNAYSENDHNFLRTLGAYVGVAISNAYAYEQIKLNNEHITDSIRYAQTIQAAILPRADELAIAYKEHFVIYRPKDIVSGDFYWQSELQIHQQYYRIAIVADCTGHGVPGAFMSMIGNTLLNEIINQKKILSPAQILEKLDRGIKTALHQEDQENSDGMDVGVCIIRDEDGKPSEVVYAGAKHSLYYYETEQLFVCKGTNRGIGGITKRKRDFEEQSITLPASSILYLASDGFADQVDGKNKKFGTKRFLELLEKIVHLPLQAQKNRIVQELELHQGLVPQRDDITIIALKV